MKKILTLYISFLSKPPKTKADIMTQIKHIPMFFKLTWKEKENIEVGNLEKQNIYMNLFVVDAFCWGEKNIHTKKQPIKKTNKQTNWQYLRWKILKSDLENTVKQSSVKWKTTFTTG